MDITQIPNHREEVAVNYVLAADLGQSSDPTAIAVLQHTHTRHLQLRGHLAPIVHEDRNTYDVRHLARLPLGLSYVEQVGEVARLLARQPLVDGCTFVLDETGVGRPVADLFDAHGMEPVRVTITGGERISGAGMNRWHVPKGLLISTLDARLHTGDLRFAAGLAEAGAMAAELKDFRRKVSAAGRYSFEARVGQHDDLVLAVAIGLWAMVGRPPPAPEAEFGTYSWG